MALLDATRAGTRRSRTGDRLTGRALRNLPAGWIVMRDAERRHIVISPYGVVLVQTAGEAESVVRGAVELSKLLRVPGGWPYVHAVVAAEGPVTEGPNVTWARREDLPAVVRSILAGREPSVDTAWAASRIRHG